MKVLRFILVGIINVIISLIVFTFLIYKGSSSEIALLASYVIGILIGFFLNKKWVFNTSKSNHDFIKYLLSYLFTYALNLLTLQLVVSADLIDIIRAQIYLVSVFALINYNLIRLFVFNSK